MGGNVESIKQRLDIVEVVSQYVKLEKSGINWKGKCPFHNEKTPSFFVSTARQSYYCFGCGKKGDIFTMTEELEGVDFKGALKLLADKAGVELTHERGESKSEKDKVYQVLEDASLFFERNLEKHIDAVTYLEKRGISAESIRTWRLGYAENDWRVLYSHLQERGFDTETILKAGLVKQADQSTKEPYDVFRGRVTFPLFDANGRVIAFSGRALDPEAVPKYLNSPETVLFQKSEVLYGLDRAKEEIRRKNYAVLVEGQMDLVLSHQAGVKNTVASSGTAFTELHLERLKRLSARIILAFDGDKAGRGAAEKSALLGLLLGMDVKIASLPEGKDPADLVRDDPEKWKEALRNSKHSIEVLLDDVLLSESDARKAGKEIVRRVLPLVALLASSIERGHFVSLIARRSGLREEVIWEDLKQMKTAPMGVRPESHHIEEESPAMPLRERIAMRLNELELWKKDLVEPSKEMDTLRREEAELNRRLRHIELEEERATLKSSIGRGEGGEEMAKRIEAINRELDEMKRKVV